MSCFSGVCQQKVGQKWLRRLYRLGITIDLLSMILFLVLMAMFFSVFPGEFVEITSRFTSSNETYTDYPRVRTLDLIVDDSFDVSRCDEYEGLRFLGFTESWLKRWHVIMACMVWILGTLTSWKFKWTKKMTEKFQHTCTEKVMLDSFLTSMALPVEALTYQTCGSQPVISINALVIFLIEFYGTFWFIPPLAFYVLCIRDYGIGFWECLSAAWILDNETFLRLNSVAEARSSNSHFCKDFRYVCCFPFFYGAHLCKTEMGKGGAKQQLGACCGICVLSIFLITIFYSFFFVFPIFLILLNLSVSIPLFFGSSAPAACVSIAFRFVNAVALILNIVVALVRPDLRESANPAVETA
eukprot:m.129046 g.129046  ORF g.129046 m.129046 type:complete len:355 (+) comp19923_c0_seq2:353-1417(+)